MRESGGGSERKGQEQEEPGSPEDTWALPCCQERAAAVQAGTWQGVGDGQTLSSAECVRELCAWACNALERGHCQSTHETGA